VSGESAPRSGADFERREDALAEFLRSAGDAPRLLTPDDSAGCSIVMALAALHWSAETGLVRPDDRLHAACFLGETGAAVIERHEGGETTYRYVGPQLEMPPKAPVDGVQVLDQLFVSGSEFHERWSAVAHFLVTTQARGALLALFGPRAPEVVHIQRWLLALLEGPLPEGADHLHAAWFSTTGAGFLFPPATFAARAGRGWSYVEIGSRRED
jgi:hypothetical protein